jgi:dihydroorotate dehydrogenase (NAD+) catalytic subunit
VKLSPNVTSVPDIAEAVVAAGADAVSLINTIPGMVIDLRTRKPYLANRTGGLSGPAIRPIAVRMVYEVAQRVDVPIVGIGGITSADDALQFLMAGATAVQVGTSTFVNPATAVQVAAGIQEYMVRNGFQTISELVGVALPGGARNVGAGAVSVGQEGAR